MVTLEIRPSVGLPVGTLGGNKEEFYRTRSAAINKFADMGLSGREISFAVEIETGIEVNPRNVVNLVNAARRRRIDAVRQLTTEEKRDIAQTTANPWNYTDKVIRRDVISILKNVRKLEEKGKSLPRNRLDLVKFRPSYKNPQPERSVGGVRVGNKIIFPDGRHIPTSKGLRQSDRQKEIAKAVNLGRQNREGVIKQSEVYERVAPLGIRVPEVSGAEWEYITAFTRKPLDKIQFRNSMARKNRPSWHSLPAEFYSPANIKKRRQRSHFFTVTKEESDHKIVAHFMDKGFFGWDLSVWKRLEDLFAVNKRQLPGDPFKRLILEIFLSAIEQAKRGNIVFLHEYKEVTRNIDPKRFRFPTEDEGLITAKLLSGWADGEDEKGFFKSLDGGRRQYRTEIVDGVYVRSNSGLEISKLKQKAIGHI